jgi:RNA polymerase primary sigma factor
LDATSVSLRREDIKHALSALPERERRVIELRFGLHGGRPRTLDEVGRSFGVTRERIRQIENSTLNTLASAAGGAAPERLPLGRLVFSRHG